jgi:long-chain acyl-CoA synthetase
LTALPRTIAHLFHRQTQRLANRPALYARRGETSLATTWQESADWVTSVARGLWELGCRKGDRVAIIAETRREWLLADLATLSFGGVVVGIYPTSTAEQVAYILQHSGSKVAILEDEAQLAKVRAHRGELPALEHVVLIERGDASSSPPSKGSDPPDQRLLHLDQLRARGRGTLAHESRWAREIRDAISPDDLATLIYTSGTTGPPKGVELTHDNLHSIALTTRDWMEIDERDVALIFLPLAHSLQRVATYAGLAAGVTAHFVTDVTQLIARFNEVQPTIAASVPRVFEKVHTKIISGVSQAPLHRRKLFEAALAVGRKRSALLQQNRPVPLPLATAYRFFDRLVFSRLRAKTFGNNISFLISGGAPIAKELLEFFHAVGVPIMEGYGLTETSAPATLNRAGELCLGSVGRPLPGSEIRVADDGEVLIRGPGVFRGYYRDPEATAAALSEDGWFASGDVGRVDDDGFLYITDRKKDLIVTAGGKNVAPQNIENLLKQDPLISQVMVHGDRRKYLVALVTLDLEELHAWARREGLEGLDATELQRRPEVEGRVDQLVTRLNATLPRYETIKRFRIVERDFSVDDGTLTPTMKVKRREVERRYQALLAELYA